MLNDGKRIILVVDDSPDSLGLVNSALNEAGYTVLVSLNGQQALDIVGQIHPHVVLMDAVMPVMDGFECCREVRKILPLTPVIFMTGLNDSEHAVMAFEQGGTDYITKPIRPAELLARIQVHLNNANMISRARAALDSARQHVFAVDPKGGYLWSTPEARNLLREHDIDPQDPPPNFVKRLATWLALGEPRNDLIIQTSKAPLTVRYCESDHSGEHLLRIVGRDTLLDVGMLERALPITRREAEVLLWVAHGKTNKEVGEILELSPRTVNKHLEQIFPKINVTNRSAATSIAIQALLGLPV